MGISKVGGCDQLIIIGFWLNLVFFKIYVGAYTVNLIEVLPLPHSIINNLLTISEQ